nr:LysR family transcriptional regulator [uncultured Undibacterium sp.]
MSQIQFNPSQTDWNLIRSFVAVVEQGSLTRAATTMGLSQPTLSRQIAELEKTVGAPLFERVARGLQLTETGENLVEPARHMMAAARSLGIAAASHDTDLQGTVRITATEIVAAFVLPDLVRQLAIRHPEIQIEVVASNQISNLLEREADIAIRMVRPTQSALIARHLGNWPIGFYAHKDYLASMTAAPVTPATRKLSSSAPASSASVVAPSIDLNALAKYRWIGLDQSDQLIAGFRAAGIHVDKSFFDFRSDSHLVNWQALLSGVGVGIAMRWLAIRESNLIAVLPEQTMPDLPIWLTSHRELKSSKRIRSVFDFLATELKKMAE